MALELKNVTFSFSPEKQILKDLSLSLDDGEIYALMGTKCSGKTTLFDIIWGFIKPQSGEFFFTPSPLKRGFCLRKFEGVKPKKWNHFIDYRTPC